jgi:hypothetical protein
LGFEVFRGFQVFLTPDPEPKTATQNPELQAAFFSGLTNLSGASAV